jgi:lipid-A-disaccharide synthase
VGEPSGDALAAELVRAAHEIAPEAHFFGMTGSELEAAGAERVVDAAQIAVMGLVEVVGRIAASRRALQVLISEAERRQPLGAILVDAPDFNLRLASRLARRHVPVIHVVSPTVWAWRAGRVRTLRRTVRRLLVTLPFEPEIYRGSGIDVVYVGNPALDRIPDPLPARQEVAERIGAVAAAPWVALLPGSRESELARVGPIVARAARLVREAVPTVEMVTPVAPGLDPARVAEALVEGPPVRLAIEGRFAALAHCAAGIVKSGTGSLELAVLGVPHVVVWAASPLTWWLARHLVDVEHVALPNLIAGKRVVPEFLQSAARPAPVAAPVVTWLTDREARDAVVAELDEVRSALGPPGFARRAAHAALEALGIAPTI